MFRKSLTAALLAAIAAMICTMCATDDTPDPEPMPTYANPWLHGQPPPETVTVAKNTPAPSTATTTTTAQPPATPTQSWNLPRKGGVQQGPPAPPAPASLQPNASSAMNFNEIATRPSS